MLTLICIDSKNYGLEHSYYNLKYNVNIKVLYQKSKKIILKQRNKQLKTLKTNFFNLIIIYNIEKVLKITTTFIKATKKYINILKYYISNVFCNNNNNKNSNKNIIKII